MASPRPRSIFMPDPRDTSVSQIPWSPGYTGPQTVTRITGPGAAPGANAPSTRPRFMATPYGGVVAFPAGLTDDEAQKALAAWEKYQEKLWDMYRASSGLQRQQIEAQIKDAEQARLNEMEIARLREQGAKYGVDAQTQQALDDRLESARQFNARHGLEMQRLGLDTAKAYTEFASTPDRAFMFSDFNDAMGRVGQGLNPAPYGASGQPQMKTWEDFAALSGFGATPAVQAGQSAATTAAQGGGPGQPGAGGDPRVKAATGILKAIPISEGQGMDDDDFAALNAIESVFRASKPGSYERLRPGQQKMFAAGLSRLGYVSSDALKQMRRNAPAQGSVRG